MRRLAQRLTIAATILGLCFALAPGVAFAAAPYWGLKASDCFDPTYNRDKVGNPIGVMYTCYKIHKVINDADSAWDYYDIHAYATADATGPKAILDDAAILVERCCGPTLYWFDWSPGGDLSGNCGTQSLGVSYGGVGLNYGHTVCETWLLTRYAAPGKLKVTWDGFTQGSRQVALMAAVKVANGASMPVWYVSWNANVRCIYGQICP